VQDEVEVKSLQFEMQDWMPLEVGTFHPPCHLGVVDHERTNPRMAERYYSEIGEEECL
jgi:hypothetical protein